MPEHRRAMNMPIEGELAVICRWTFQTRWGVGGEVTSRAGMRAVQALAETGGCKK